MAAGKGNFIEVVHAVTTVAANQPTQRTGRQSIPLHSSTIRCEWITAVDSVEVSLIELHTCLCPPHVPVQPSSHFHPNC